MPMFPPPQTWASAVEGVRAARPVRAQAMAKVEKAVLLTRAAKLVLFTKGMIWGRRYRSAGAHVTNALQVGYKSLFSCNWPKTPAFKFKSASFLFWITWKLRQFHPDNTRKTRTGDLHAR